MDKLTCAYTGHRPQGLPFGYNEADPRCAELKEALRAETVSAVECDGAAHFITGMALGVDLLAAEVVLELKITHPELTLEAAVPCIDQASRWRADQKRRYEKILSAADRKTLISREYTPDCMHRRNRYMVDKCDILIAVWNGSAGGTGSTVRYALSRKKRVRVIDPQTLHVREL